MVFFVTLYEYFFVSVLHIRPLTLTQSTHTTSDVRWRMYVQFEYTYRASWMFVDDLMYDVCPCCEEFEMKSKLCM